MNEEEIGNEFTSENAVNIPCINILNSNYYRMKRKENNNELEASFEILHKRRPRRAKQITPLLLSDLASCLKIDTTVNYNNLSSDQSQLKCRPSYTP